MLGALAGAPTGLTQDDLSVRAVLSQQTGTMSDYMSTLRVRGYITEADGKIYITEEGKPFADPPPRHSQELLARWLVKPELKAGTRRILEKLVECYPQRLDREELGRRTELSIGTGTWSDYLSVLRSRTLICESPDRTQFWASPALFPER